MKTIKILVLFIFGLFIFSGNILAEENNNGIKSFEKFKLINNLNLKVPQVVELPFENGELNNRKDFAVLEMQSDKFEPYYFVKRKLISWHALSSDYLEGRPEYLLDKKYDTFLEYAMPEEGLGKAEITLNYSLPISSSFLEINLDNYVALPTFIEISAESNGKEKILLARTKMRSERIFFPKTEASLWHIKFEYSQPLRLTELELNQENKDSNNQEVLRFLARPGMDYKVYFNSDRFPEIKTGESGNLADDKEVLKLNLTQSAINPAYTKADIDEDDIPDKLDNCVKTANPKQEDINNNLRGDACDDFDKDGIINAKDNCIDIANFNQEDTDGDKIGNVCDNEESRPTEKMPWLPWAGMGFVAAIIGFLLLKTIKNKV